MHSNESEHSREREHRSGERCPALDDLSAFVDNELSPQRSASIRDHIAACGDCSLVVDDFRLLQRSMIETTPRPLERSFRLTEAMVGTSDRPAAVSTDKRLVPLFPVLTAIAAILVIALIAGEFLGGGSDSTSPARQTTSDVLYIDGTPFTSDDNDAEFGAASTNVMNAENPDPSTQVSNAEDGSSGMSGWRIPQLLALAAFIALATLWYRKRRASSRVTLK